MSPVLHWEGSASEWRGWRHAKAVPFDLHFDVNISDLPVRGGGLAILMDWMLNSDTESCSGAETSHCDSQLWNPDGS